MQDTVRENLLQIQEDIAPYKPNIIAVTKYFDEKAMIEAYNAGLRDFAESRAVEAVEKIENLPAEVRNNSKFHFIGHLQTNKVKKVVPIFDYIHSVDSLKLAKAIADEAKLFGKVQNILLQVNNANEEQKFGFSKKEIFEVFPSIKELSSVSIAGIMNMAPLGASEEELNRLFEDVFNIKKELEQRFDCELRELSMGMSQDYKIAVKHGATMLRIGRKLFIK
ncbi:YggS family pyridoxal phosphate enzyme [Candidatus Melainabacteria bacterium MEL.A1]|jgi:pyridoxal phosphate enzyme, yggS family|nr:YggS family pyridoxal phosphate enzyme [Candidatus Melainabacteria bacterium MEL.A1]CCX79581.1 alanine racemase domain protein [Clostridium sp. CAG:715]DAA84260.1 MAG TPA: YggS family pyridoxal phosphate-dependent enzyme [Candidatus Gastranaerophilales bacterium HUM_2]